MRVKKIDKCNGREMNLSFWRALQPMILKVNRDFEKRILYHLKTETGLWRCDIAKKLIQLYVTFGLLNLQFNNYCSPATRYFVAHTHTHTRTHTRTDTCAHTRAHAPRAHHAHTRAHTHRMHTTQTRTHTCTTPPSKHSHPFIPSPSKQEFFAFQYGGY